MTEDPTKRRSAFTADSVLRFRIAVLEVELRGGPTLDLTALAPAYSAYHSTCTSPDLVIDVERVASIDAPAATASPQPPYPALRRQLSQAGTLLVSRGDVAGELRMSAAPMTARFQVVGNHPSSIDAAIRVAIGTALPRRGGLLLHASSVGTRRGALVFAGHSGAGKSTISELLSSTFPSCRKLSDEILAVARAPEGSWLAYVTPFRGIAGLPLGESERLEAMHFLVQAKNVKRHPLAPVDAIRALMPNILAYVAETQTAAHVLHHATQLAADVACHRLEFNLEPEALDAVLSVT